MKIMNDKSGYIAMKYFVWRVGKYTQFFTHYISSEYRLEKMSKRYVSDIIYYRIFFISYKWLKVRKMKNRTKCDKNENIFQLTWSVKFNFHKKLNSMYVNIKFVWIVFRKHLKSLQNTNSSKKYHSIIWNISRYKN